MKLTVSQKGIILIGVLVLMEGAFIASLTQQVFIAEAEAVSQNEQLEVLFGAQHLCNDLYNEHEALSSWLSGPGEDTEADVRKGIKRVNTDMDFLMQKSERDSVRFAELKQIKQFVQDAETVINTWLEKIKNVPPGEDLKAYIGAARDAIRDPKKRVLDFSVAFLKAQVQLFATGPESHSQMAENLRLIVWAGLLGNILLACILGLVYARNITDRLAVLIENTGRLSTHKELAPPVAGADEIAELDKTFRAMAHQMDQDDHMRRTYIQMFRNELGKPLGAVQHRLRGLQNSPGSLPSEKAEKTISTAERNLSRLVSIIDDLTGAGELQPKIKLHIREVAPAELIETSVDSVKAMADKYGTTIHTDIELNEKIRADGERIIQVIVNLLSNAIKYSPKGKEVRVVCKRTAAGLVELSVIDQGRGVPADKQATLFEKFEQVETSDGARGTGTGLGLSVCKDIIEMHGGQIGLESEIGKGSRFWFTLLDSKEKNQT